MKEPIENVIFICPDCTKERKKLFRNSGVKPKLKDFVKITFTDKDVKEHMWVEITKIDDNQYEGKLSNDPFYVTNCKYGDKVKFKYTNIEEHMAV